jgi:multidrug efflux pump subunit AcrA (membrane-fusion protein)
MSLNNPAGNRPAAWGDNPYSRNRIPMPSYMTRSLQAIVFAVCLLAAGRCPVWAQAETPLFSGKAYPETRAELRTYGSGDIKEFSVTVGTFVKENSTLLVYEGDNERLMEIKKKLSKAEVYELEWKKAELNRLLNKQMRDIKLYDHYLAENMATKSQIENASMTVNALEMQLDSIEEKLSNAKDEVRAEQINAKYSLGINNAQSKDVKRLLRMHAPIQGHILWMNPDFHVGARMKHDVRAFVIGDMRRVKLVCEAYEAAMQDIKEGQRVTVRFDAIQGKTYPGVVSKTQWASANVNEKDKPSVFEVEVAIDNKNLDIKEGYVGHVYKAG